MTAILFFSAASLSALAARQPSGLAALWPASALVLGLFLARGRSRADIGAIAGGAVLASAAFHLLRGDTIGATILFGLANINESLIAFLLLRAVGRAGTLFDHVGDVLMLAAACLVSCVFSAAFGTAALAGAGRTDIVPIFVEWYRSNLLSELVVAPMVVIVAQLGDGRWARTLAAARVAEILLVFAPVAAVTAAIFLTRDLPLLFLVGPFVLFATFRLRVFGAVGAVAIVAAIASYAAAFGGVVIAGAGGDAGESLLLQLFLACCILTALPLAAMLNDRDARAEEARQLAARFKAVVENIGEVIFQIDPDGRWAYLNPAWEAISGQPIARSIGSDWLDRVDVAERPQLERALRVVLDGATPAERRNARFVTAAGLRWMELYVQGLRDQDGAIVGATGTLRDIDDRKRLEDHVMSAKRRAEQRAQEATVLASTDELTGIANRRAFMRQLDREIAGAAEFGWPLAVAMFDVDHFKRVNDRHGHAVGDRVLQHIAARAGATIRGGDLVGRLGGEEFAILMPGASAEDAALVAERLRRAIETRRPEDGDLPAVTVSIGVAAREDQRDAGQLLAAADVALYAAKGAGRNRIRVAA